MAAVRTSEVKFTRKDLESLIGIEKSVKSLERKIDALEDVGPALKTMSKEQSRLDSSVIVVTETINKVGKKIDTLEVKVDGIQKNNINKLENTKSKRLLWTAIATALISAMASILVVILR